VTANIPDMINVDQTVLARKRQYRVARADFFRQSPALAKDEDHAGLAIHFSALSFLKPHVYAPYQRAASGYQ
jgi:hypothetical protein